MSPPHTQQILSMAEGDEGWTWPSWGSGHGVLALGGDAMAEEEAEVEQKLEEGGKEERIMVVEKEAEIGRAHV